MNPFHDVVLSLQVTPFPRRPDFERREILQGGRPCPEISTLTKDKKGGRQYTRTFQSSWYTTYSWLCGSVFKQRLYCWPCLLLGKTKTVWIYDGYVDFKNFSRSARMHDASKDHIQNSLGLVRLSQNMSTIEDALIENARLSKILYNEDVRKNRLLMTYLIDTTILLGKQELAFRGHDESESSFNKGNFKEIFNCLIKRNSELVKHLEEKQVFAGQSKTIQNELIFCVENYIKEFINNEISEASFFSVIVDDTTDIVAKAQCCITVRYVNKAADIKERFLGFFDVSRDTRASGLYYLLVNVLEQYNFREKLIGQCYDGAAVMAGELNGLQARIKSTAPRAFYTHCAAHRLNLILQQGVNYIKETRVFFATLYGLPAFFHKSYKRTSILENILKKRVPQANDTRWYSRSKILFFVTNNWEGLILVFQDMIENSQLDSDTIRMAKGYLKDFSDFEFAFLSFMFKEIFVVTEILFNIFQLSNLNISFCTSQISIALDRLKQLRTETAFSPIYEKAKSLTGLPSNRQHSQMSSLDISNKYRILFYEILDCIILQLHTRFDDINKLDFVELLNNSSYQKFINEFPSSILSSVEKSYPNLFDTDRLKNELSIIYRDEQFRNIDIFKSLKLINESGLLSIFPEVYKLASLILTIPVTSVQAERDFSCLKRIKTYLRNTMLQERLSALSLFSIEKELLVKLSENDGKFYDNIIDKFVSLKDRRINLIYKK